VIVYRDSSLAFDGPVRAHPWTVSDFDPSCRYVNFVDQPELIESVLEDFWGQEETGYARSFYQLIRSINAKDGQLETNDCGFMAPRSHSDRNSSKALVATSRLCVLFRANAYNVVEGASNWLGDSYYSVLQRIDSEFAACDAVVGLTLQQTAFISLPGESNVYLGRLLMLSFWCYGDTDEEVFANFERSSRNVEYASKIISDHIASKFNHAGVLQDFHDQKCAFVLDPEDEL
jgi:hypothetical protein